jgi:hypothetical protein
MASLALGTTTGCPALPAMARPLSEVPPHGVAIGLRRRF